MDIPAPIIEFAGSEISASEFAEWLYADKLAEVVFSTEDAIPPYTSPGWNLYYYLIERDYRNPGDVLNATGAISKFLDKRGVSYKKSPNRAQLYSTLLKAQPKWLDVSGKYLKEITKEAECIPQKERLAWLKNRFSEDFKSLKSPPKWLQAPQWPCNEGRPPVFVGQLDISNISHDLAQLYVFYDGEHATFNTIVQSV